MRLDRTDAAWENGWCHLDTRPTTARVTSAPKLSSLEAEECAVAAALLHDDAAFLEEAADEDFFYEHIRPVISAVRMLRGADKPCGTVFVLAALSSRLDALTWQGDSGEVLILDILSRRVADPQAYYSRQLGRLIHYYAEKRKAMQEAQEAAKRTFTETLDMARAKYLGEI